MSSVIAGPWGASDEMSGGFDKELQFSGVTGGQLDNRLIELDFIAKLASTDIANEVGKFINSLRAQPDKIYVLNVALGASDAWGTNNNGEFFFDKKPLADFPQVVSRFPSLARYSSGGLLTDHPRYGSKTFLNNPAHFFDHHRNKDVNKAYGRCVFQFFNPEMQRVELVFELWPNKMIELGSSDVLDRLENDTPIESSMGCRVPWDMCSECGNVARIKQEYCSCLRNLMNRILPDGRRVGAMNFLSSFHDMSRVNKNADRSSYVLQKVAREGRQPVVENKQAASRKKAVIYKRIGGLSRMIDVARTDKAIPVNKLRKLREKAKTVDILGASTKTAFVFKPQEFQFLFLEDAVPGLGEKYASEGICFESITDVAPITVGEATGYEDLLTEFLEDRWLSDDALSSRFLKVGNVEQDEIRFEKIGVLPSVSALYNGYICGIMGRVLTHGVSTEFVKSAAVRPKAPLKVMTPLSLGTGALAYMMASMLQSISNSQDQEKSITSLLTDPRVAGILTMTGTAALRRKLGT